MAFANFTNLCGCVPVARANFSQIFARHAIETVDRLSMIARRHKQFVKRSPIIAPIEIEANALAQVILINLAAPPLVKNMLIAREDCLDAEDDWAITLQCTLFE